MLSHFNFLGVFQLSRHTALKLDVMSLDGYIKNVLAEQ